MDINDFMDKKELEDLLFVMAKKDQTIFDKPKVISISAARGPIILQPPAESDRGSGNIYAPVEQNTGPEICGHIYVPIRQDSMSVNSPPYVSEITPNSPNMFIHIFSRRSVLLNEVVKKVSEISFNHTNSVMVVIGGKLRNNPKSSTKYIVFTHQFSESQMLEFPNLWAMNNDI
jgi:hypothetical protein